MLNVVMSRYAECHYAECRCALFRIQWKGSNHKQSARWQHVSRLKASALYIWYNKLWWFKTQKLILGTGTAIWWVTEPHCQTIQSVHLQGWGDLAHLTVYQILIRSWHYPQILDCHGKKLQRANTLAYFAPLSVMKKNVF